MNRVQKVAVTSGILGFLFSFLNPGIFLEVLWMLERAKPGEILRVLLGLLFLYVGPAFLMALGAYQHSISGKKSGFALVIVGAVILIVELPILLVALPYWIFISDWLERVFLILQFVPGLMAIVTLAASAMPRARVRPI